MSIASDRKEPVVVTVKLQSVPLSVTREMGGGEGANGTHTSILLGFGLSYHPSLI